MIIKLSKRRIGFLLPYIFFVIIALRSKAGLGIEFAPTPHDSQLYLSHATNLLKSNFYGDYGSTTLLKNLALGNILAFFGLIGITYNYAIFGLQLAIASTFSYITKKISKSYIISILIFANILFFPLSYTHIWHQILREPINILFALSASYSAYIIIFSFFHKCPKNIAKMCFAIYSFACCGLFFVREEGFLLFWLSFLSLIVAACISDKCTIKKLISIFNSSHSRLTVKHYLLSIYKHFPNLFKVISSNFITLVLILSISACQLLIVKIAYNSNTINDFSKGLFPVFISKIRSYCNSDDSWVSIPQSCVNDINNHIKSLKPIFDAVGVPPAETSNTTYERYERPGEWPNSHHFIWIKDSLHVAFKPNDASETDDLLKDFIVEIDNYACNSSSHSSHPLCENGKLKYMQSLASSKISLENINLMKGEFLRGIKVLSSPEPAHVVTKTLAYHPGDYTRENFRKLIGSKIVDNNSWNQIAQIANSPSLFQQNAISYLRIYDDVANSIIGRPITQVDLDLLKAKEIDAIANSALKHYIIYGIGEGRIWGNQSNAIAPDSSFSYPLHRSSRNLVIKLSKGLLYFNLGATIVTAAIFTTLSYKNKRRTILPLLFSIIFCVSIVSMSSLVLSYISVTFGMLDNRMYFTPWAFIYSFISLVPFLLISFSRQNKITA